MQEIRKKTSSGSVMPIKLQSIFINITDDCFPVKFLHLFRICSTLLYEENLSLIKYH